LRAPAAWCNVVGMRPSPGRVPSWPTRLAWSTLSTAGPMGRTVEDVALLLAAQAGPDPRSPIAIEEPGERFLAPLARDFRDVRVAWSPDLGFLPVEPDVQAVCEAALPVLESLGCRVEHACPDLRGASEVFKVLRAAKFAIDRREEIARHRERIRPTIIANAEEGFALAGLATSEAEERRTVLWHRVREFMEGHEFLVWPVNPVSPFPADQETVTRIGEVAIGSYIDWGALRHIVSVLGLPAISVPAGFTPGGLPVGLQVIGRHHRDLEVLQLAFAFQEATGYWRRRPPAAG
jgi:amidase